MSVLARTQDTMAHDQATVHVIDDDVSPREALSLLFLSIGLDVRTYASVQEFLNSGAHDRPGCILLDVRLPGISGLDFQSRRDEFGVHLPIVLMTGHGDVPMSVRAMKAGAVDFLTKPFRDQDVIDAVMAAIELDRERRAAESATAGIRDRYASLSPREQQVMALVTAGKISKQVAFDLGLSEITVKTYRGAMMQKMGARTFADLVRMADALALCGASAATKSLAIEHAKLGIRVNAVAPGVIKTPMHPVETHAKLAKLHPLGRMGEISEIVDAILYLESAGFVTGETIHVDGGQSAGH